ncbi:hypothetical protein THICB1_20162 [Thiomonas arsenitoxydans]|uniref:Uncharacterized protein n=1 Tax=Thiomonas arsenitoxydans (strain DSM 22701 / CIP 110005 / 3As) TaxID=426114 RepID=A0ABM9T6J9_THIA3|nr:hypothetical protein THICB1_20162 [Thiomonas arsenitoxydans]
MIKGIILMKNQRSTDIFFRTY